MWINSELSVSDEITQKIKIATVTKMSESGNHEVRPWFLLNVTVYKSANVYFRVGCKMKGSKDQNGRSRESRRSSVNSKGQFGRYQYGRSKFSELNGPGALNWIFEELDW